MKTALYTLIGVLGCLQSCLAGPEGLWGGKWDDQWNVFLKIESGADANSYKVQYIWNESTTEKSFRNKEYVGKRVGAYFEAGPLMIFKIDGDKGILYGAFRNPRMANLVRINSGLPSVPESDGVLRKHGWKEGAVPASEALAKITNGAARTISPEFLAGTKWLWYGSQKNPMTFMEDGTIDKQDWTNKGLVTGWKVTGPNQVTLNILKGRTNYMTATLEFASNLGSFTGIDFNGSSVIAKSPRVR